MLKFTKFKINDSKNEKNNKINKINETKKNKRNNHFIVNATIDSLIDVIFIHIKFIFAISNQRRLRFFSFVKSQKKIEFRKIIIVIFRQFEKIENEIQKFEHFHERETKCFINKKIRKFMQIVHRFNR